MYLQLKDTSRAVFARQKSTSIADLFSNELKLGMELLKAWFYNRIKSKFVELDYIRRQNYRKANPVVPSETTCSICRVLLDENAVIEHKSWYNFIVEWEHLLLRNIYNSTDLEKTDIAKFIQALYPDLENALGGEDLSEELPVFL